MTRIETGFGLGLGIKPTMTAVWNMCGLKNSSGWLFSSLKLTDKIFSVLKYRTVQLSRTIKIIFLLCFPHKQTLKEIA